MFPRERNTGARTDGARPHMRPSLCPRQAACLLLLLGKVECFGGLKSLSSGNYHLEKPESFTAGMFGVGAGNAPSDSPYNMPVKQVHAHHPHMHPLHCTCTYISLHISL